MGYNLCLIDDGFMVPAIARSLERYKCFSISTIDVLLQEEWGVETALKELCETFVNDEDENNKKKWQLTAFTNPEYFREKYEEEDYRSDIIIFDWEYGTLSGFDQISFLNEILLMSYSYICIFSGADKDDEIQRVLGGDLGKYSHRIFFINKGNNNDYSDSAKRLYEKIKRHQESNFAFKFGKKLRAITNKSLDDVLLHLSEMDIERIIEHFGKYGTEPIDNDLKEMIGGKIKDKLNESKDIKEALSEVKNMTFSAIVQFLEIISEKIKNEIISSDLEHSSLEKSASSEVDNTVLQKLWAYRLYHHPNDDFVRTGDLVKLSDKGNDKIYLILTPLCDLERFWVKTYGCLNMVELFDVKEKKEYISGQVLLVKKLADIRKNIKITSISNPINALGGDVYYIPYLKIEDDYCDYLLFPKKITYDQIEMPDVMRGDQVLKNRHVGLEYKMISKYKRIATISAPFLEPIIGGLFGSLRGYGTPDYSEKIKETLACNCKEIFS